MTISLYQVCLYEAYDGSAITNPNYNKVFSNGIAAGLHLYDMINRLTYNFMNDIYDETLHGVNRLVLIRYTEGESQEVLDLYWIDWNYDNKTYEVIKKE